MAPGALFLMVTLIATGRQTLYNKRYIVAVQWNLVNMNSRGLPKTVNRSFHLFSIDDMSGDIRWVHIKQVFHLNSVHITRFHSIWYNTGNKHEV